MDDLAFRSLSCASPRRHRSKMTTAFALGTSPCLLSVSPTMMGSPRTSNILLVYICANQIFSSLQFFKGMDYGSVSSVQFSSVAQSCPTLCDPTSRSTPGRPVHHQLPEFTQTHVHRVGDAIQPFHPLSPSPPAFSLSQHQGLFQ